MTTKDTWLAMLDALIRRAEYRMRLQGAYMDSAKEACFPVEDIRALDVDGASEHATFNMLTTIRDNYIRGKEKGKMGYDTENVLSAAMSAYKEMQQRWKP
jgi:hypothetical protein